MGDALSCAALRLFKWWRETSTPLADDVVHYPSSRCHLVSLHTHNLLVLDLSFRDDIRFFCAWRSSGLSQSSVLAWCSSLAKRRYEHGSMTLDNADPNIFIGLHTTWHNSDLVTRPCLHDPWGTHTYHLGDNCRLLPWCSWGSAHRKLATIRGLFARSWYLSSNGAARITAFHQTLCALTLTAGFPTRRVLHEVRLWTRSWCPKHPHADGSTAVSVREVECAVASFLATRP